MPDHPHRTPEMKARRVARKHARTQEDLNRILSQFSPVHHAGLLARLRPHLEFEPAPGTRGMPAPHDPPSGQ